MSNKFNCQFKNGEFDIYCPLCGQWIHAFHLRDEEDGEETCCLDCEIGVCVSFDYTKREIKLRIDDGSSWKFNGKGSEKSASK